MAASARAGVTPRAPAVAGDAEGLAVAAGDVEGLLVAAGDVEGLLVAAGDVEGLAVAAGNVEGLAVAAGDAAAAGGLLAETATTGEEGESGVAPADPPGIIETDSAVSPKRSGAASRTSRVVCLREDNGPPHSGRRSRHDRDRVGRL